MLDHTLQLSSACATLVAQLKTINKITEFSYINTLIIPPILKNVSFKSSGLFAQITITEDIVSTDDMLKLN